MEDPVLKRDFRSPIIQPNANSTAQSGHWDKAAANFQKWRKWHVFTIAILLAIPLGLMLIFKDLKEAQPTEWEPSGIRKSDAVIACVDAITPQLSQPRSAEFRTFADTTFSTDDTRSRVTIGFSAKNGLGLMLDQTAACIFDGKELQSAEILPAS